MSDPIERQAAIDLMTLAIEDDWEVGYATDRMNELSSAQPEPQNGKWVVTSRFDDCVYAKCDQCNTTQVFYYNKALTNFCPNCGADLREDQDDQSK